MKVYLHGSDLKPPPEIASHTLFCCPAGHQAGDTPAEWWDVTKDRPVPKNFTIEFRYGESDEISDSLARYLIDTGQASATEWKRPRPDRWS